MTTSRKFLTRSLVEIPARWYGQKRVGHVRVIVIHTAECREVKNAARAVANYFASTKRKASAHITVDNKEAVRSLQDNKIAWAAPGCNFDGLHLELVGTANQSKTDWKDAYSENVLNLAAKVVAEWCYIHSIPAIKLNQMQLLSGRRGIVGHVDVSKAYKKSTHFDPGTNFPWESFIKKVENELAVIKS